MFDALIMDLVERLIESDDVAKWILMRQHFNNLPLVLSHISQSLLSKLQAVQFSTSLKLNWNKCACLAIVEKR